MNCGKCHTCESLLEVRMDGEEWCPRCRTWRRYVSHGWTQKTATADDLGPCPLRDEWAIVESLDNAEHAQTWEDDPYTMHGVGGP